MKLGIEYICPDCKEILTLARKGLVCKDCDASYEIEDDIPSFTNKEFYWCEIPRSSMKKLLEYAQKNDWKSAIYDELANDREALYRTIGDDRRANWKYLLPINKKWTTVDIGCGWGAVAIGLSKACGKVVALDATWERVKFLRLRKDQQGIDNIYPVHAGGNLDFPFPDNCFDLASLVGVLEWFGASSNDIKPDRCQLIALNNIKRILKKGGYLYIGIENRFGFDYLMGKPDHNGVRFVSFLPRWLADRVSLAQTGKPYVTYQYSMYGYRKLLNKAGFSDIQFYAPLPQYRQPQYYLPLDGTKAFEYFWKHYWKNFVSNSSEYEQSHKTAYQLASYGIKWGAALKILPLMKPIVPGFSIIARN